MLKALGLLEFKTTPVGISVADEMLKSSNVSLVSANPICPGKYIVIIAGDVGSVRNAVQTGIQSGGSFVVNSEVMNNVDKSVIPALSGTVEISQLRSVGVIETMSAITSIVAGDIAVKAANVDLLEIRLARGLGGKGFITFTGEISQVEAATNSCLAELKESGELVSNRIINSPHKELIKAIY